LFSTKTRDGEAKRDPVEASVIARADVEDKATGRHLRERMLDILGGYTECELVRKVAGQGEP
jgi:hypothetical protein